MTSDDVSVIWKSAFSFTMSTRGGGGGGIQLEQSKKKETWKRGGKKNTPRLLRCETHNLCHKRGHKKCTKHTGIRRANTRVTPACLDSHAAGCP